MTYLKAVVFAAWHVLSPRATLGPDAAVIADAIEYAVEHDASPPVTGSRVGDAVLQATYAWYESGAMVNPRPMSWDARAGISCGTWQMPCHVVRSHTLRGQAQWWLDAMHRATRICPSAPGAPLCGSCRGALPRRMATYRWATAAAIARDIVARRAS